MTERIHATQVGAPDPGSWNSLIVEEAEDDYDYRIQDPPG